VLLEAVDQIDQVRLKAAEAIERPCAQRVAGTHHGKRLVEARTGPGGTRNSLVLKGDTPPGCLQRTALKVEMLFAGRHPHSQSPTSYLQQRYATAKSLSSPEYSFVARGNPFATAVPFGKHQISASRKDTDWADLSPMRDPWFSHQKSAIGEISRARSPANSRCFLFDCDDAWCHLTPPFFYFVPFGPQLILLFCRVCIRSAPQPSIM
jgi:hypothetical protein